MSSLYLGDARERRVRIRMVASRRVITRGPEGYRPFKGAQRLRKMHGKCWRCGK